MSVSVARLVLAHLDAAGPANALQLAGALGANVQAVHEAVRDHVRAGRATRDESVRPMTYTSTGKGYRKVLTPEERAIAHRRNVKAYMARLSPERRREVNRTRNERLEARRKEKRRLAREARAAQPKVVKPKVVKPKVVKPAVFRPAPPAPAPAPTPTIEDFLQAGGVIEKLPTRW